jgi:hypothetical protein
MPTGAGRFGFRLSAGTAVTGNINGSIEEGSSLTGSMFQSSGIANYGSRMSVLTAGHRFSLASAESESRNGKSVTRGASMEFANGFKVGVTSNRETGSALSMRGTGAFNIEGAKSTFATLGWTGELGGFRLAGEGMIGRTRVETRNAIIEFTDPVISSGFRLQAEHGALGGFASFGLTTPLRVEHAKLRYTAGVGYDPEEQALVTETRTIDLTPDARALTFEMNWGRSLGRSSLSFGGAYGFNAGNIRGANSAAAWLNLGTRF